MGNIPMLCGPHPGHHRPDLPGQLAQEGHQPHQLAGVGSYVMGLSHKNGLFHLECTVGFVQCSVSVMDPVLRSSFRTRSGPAFLFNGPIYFTKCITF